MNYYDIPRYLKRYQFPEKMRVLHHFSKQLLEHSGNSSIEKMMQSAHPWELETLLLFSLKSTPEFSDNNFEGKNINKFIDMINGVRDFQHPLQEKKIGSIHFADYIMVVLGLSQFDIQEFLPYKYYRYSYIFNFTNDNLDMKSLFKSYYGTSYEEFRKLGTILNLLESLENKIITQEILDYVVLRECPIAYQNLSLNSEEYLEQLDNITMNQEDYLYCLRPSYKFPFIIHNDRVYYPLPHILGRSVTSSLLYRMTDGNNELRTLIGKHVLEKYLYDLLIGAQVYDEVIPEQEFKLKHNNNARTLDVMVRKDNKFLFLDSKSSVPRANLRIMDEEAFEKEIEIASKNIIQVYNHISVYFPDIYNFFDFNDFIYKENIYGAVVTLEDNFIRRGLIYEHVANKLKIGLNTDEYNWIVNHIKIVSFYDIEKASFIGKSIIDELERQKNNNRSYDYSLVDNFDGDLHIINNSYLDFKKEWLSVITEVAENMKRDNIIS